MSQELIIEFALTASRQEFLKKFRQQMVDFVGSENKEFILMLTEIAKNIHDHNNGRGYARLRKEFDGKVYFELANIIEPWNAKPILVNQEEDRVNYRFGLSANGILTIARILNIDLEFSPADGFLYKGSYKLK